MDGKRVGFISFRFAGTDGVSLETAKWAEVLERNGHSCFYFAGELDTPAERSFLVDLAHYKNPEIVELTSLAFGQPRRSVRLSDAIHRLRDYFKRRIYDFIDQFKLDLLIPENLLTIPLNLPLASALSEVIAETGLPVIAHHHDFFWERKRFLTNCVWDYLNSTYPPSFPTIHHVVINSSARNQLALRKGVGSTLIPNVMKYESPPAAPDEYARDVRASLGVEDDERLFLQPTRVIQRKGIEHSIELVARLGRMGVKGALVISHASGDEGNEYERRVREYADLLGIRALFVSDIISDRRGATPDGRKIYTLQDIYPHADLVTYPSLFEGFGNAFLEAIYFRRPILVNNYTIYSYDIRPLGFDVVEMDEFLSDRTIQAVKELLRDDSRVARMTEKNYELALRHFSYGILETKLSHLFTNIWGRSGAFSSMKSTF